MNLEKVYKYTLVALVIATFLALSSGAVLVSCMILNDGKPNLPMKISGAIGVSGVIMVIFLGLVGHIIITQQSCSRNHRENKTS